MMMKKKLPSSKSISIQNQHTNKHTKIFFIIILNLNILKKKNIKDLP